MFSCNIFPGSWTSHRKWLTFQSRRPCSHYYLLQGPVLLNRSMYTTSATLMQNKWAFFCHLTLKHLSIQTKAKDNVETSILLSTKDSAVTEVAIIGLQTVSFWQTMAATYDCFAIGRYIYMHFFINWLIVSINFQSLKYSYIRAINEVT